MPTILTLDGIRSAIPAQGLLPPDPLPPTKSEPNDPISLGGWLKASGKMQISCKENGSALVMHAAQKPCAKRTLFGIGHHPHNSAWFKY